MDNYFSGTVYDALKIVDEDVADNVYRHPTLLQVLNYVVNEITPAELANIDDPRIRAAYDVVRTAHDIDDGWTA